MKTIRPGLIIALLLNMPLIYGQKNYSDGYIITLQNDTIHGKIRNNVMSNRAVKLMDENGKITRYTADKIKGYSKAGIIDYLSVQENVTKIFAKVVVNGDIALLTIEKSGTYMPGPYGSGSVYTNPKTIYYLLNTKTDSTVRVYPLGFKDQMADYFSDDVKLKDMILNKELRLKDLEVIVATYDKWKKEQTLSKEKG